MIRKRIRTGFADNYNREGELIRFPSDVAMRKQYLINWKDEGLEADHPAKANLHLTRELILHTTEPGDRIMDITAGAGSVLIGLLDGRDPIAIDIAPHFARWIRHSAEKLSDYHIQGVAPLVLEGDCRDFLPIPVQSIIFSPPYAGAFNAGGGILSRDKAWGAAVEQYRHDPRNLGNLTNFLYNRAMAEIYKLCYDSLPPGGKLSLIIKDRILKGQRVFLGLAAVRVMTEAGFELFEWHMWKPPGSMFVSIKKSKGETVVEDEHIIIMQRPKDE
tara:strand:- start:1859 stop:2680 length:822 start_codon:yes stop_codon:yes gene_type:complete